MKATITLVIDDKDVNDAVNDLITTAGTRELSVDEFIDNYNYAVYGYNVSMPGNKAPGKKATVKKKSKKK